MIWERAIAGYGGWRHFDTISHRNASAAAIVFTRVVRLSLLVPDRAATHCETLFELP
jgi:hypothetical protein